MIRETAKAKINLDLRVCGRRDDGYHDLDSLVVFTDLGDELIFTQAASFSLVIEGPFAAGLGGEQNNLVQGAALGLAEAFGRSPDVAVTLIKHLPISAGIGGGSADAAATLRGLVRLWDLPMAHVDLLTVARKLGADVPVCLASKPAGMTGIGDGLKPLSLPEPLWILLANPGTPVSTPCVFEALTTMSAARPAALDFEDAASFRQSLLDSINDLEAPAKGLVPLIDDVNRMIAQQAGCWLARMSGSGATCFGLFQDQASLAEASLSLKTARPDWWIEPTLCR